MKIRIYRDSDEPQVVALWREVFAYPEPRNDPIQVIRHKLAVQPELFFVATIEERVVGTVMAGYDGHRGWIYSLAVSSEFRGRGVGTVLMRHAESALRDLGCPKINLQVLSANRRVIAFYQKLGYTVEDRISMGRVVPAP